MDSFQKIPRHELIRNWLGKEMVDQLLVYAKKNEQFFTESELAHGLDRSRRVSRKMDLGELKQKLLPKIREVLPHVFKALHISPFTPTFETELVAHGDGAFFAKHYDTITYRRRVISGVYYFHLLPKAFFGGVLRLHSMATSGRQGTFVDIPPDYDTLVFFPSMFPHEVLPINVPSGNFMESRFAINIWVNQSAERTQPHG